MKTWILALTLVLLIPAAQAESGTPSSVVGTSYVEVFLDYRLAIQTKIETAWAEYLRTFRGSVPRGRAVFTYHVNPDGKITLIEPRQGGNPVITALAHRAIVEANNTTMIPFPDQVRERHASGYFNQIAFVLR